MLGRELARATKRERRHRAASRHVTSPLAGVAYDSSAGELDMHRFVESPVDAALREFASNYRTLDADEANAARAALTMDDFYTLLVFARRSALASLQGRSDPSLGDGLAALTAIDQDRVDWRDVAVTAELLAWAMARAGLDHAAELQRAGMRSQPGVAEALRGIADRPGAELQPGMYRCVETPAGPVLAHDYFEPFEPTVDLVSLALAVQEVVEADRYRVSGLTVAGDLPLVWLTPGDSEDAVRAALDRVRGCVSVDGELDPAVASNAKDQQLIVFLAEAANEPDARLLAASALPAKSHDAIGLTSGEVCCVVIASSVVIGVPAFERAGALGRFKEPLAGVLDRSRAG